MSKIDPYVMLGVKKSASLEEIKSAYRKKALKYHPDRNPGDPQAEELFKSVSTAYSMIGSKDAKEEYDRSRAPRRPSRNPPGFNDIFRNVNVNFGNHSNNAHGTWDDLFGSFQSTHRKPFVIKARVDVTLEDLVRCTQKTFMMDGNSVSFNIPKGARDGMNIIVPMSNSQELHATISVIDHPFFTISGDDLRCVIPVPVSVAVAGGEVTAVTLDSDVRLKIPKFTDSHQKLRIKNYGLPKADGTRGSIIYELRMTFDMMSEDEKARLESYIA